MPAELDSRTNRPDRPTAALEQIEAALAAGIPRGVVLAPLGYGVGHGAGYGAAMTFRVLRAEIGLEAIVGVPPSATIWTTGEQPLQPEAWSRQNWSGAGRLPSNLRRAADHQPLEARIRAMQLSPEAWQGIIGCLGTKGERGSRFTHARSRLARR